jgi:hypothetical protein
MIENACNPKPHRSGCVVELIPMKRNHQGWAPCSHGPSQGTYAAVMNDCRRVREQ